MISDQQTSCNPIRCWLASTRGYIAKGNPLELEEAIGQVLQGVIYLSEPLRQQQAEYHQA